jgi:hypothetical protein
MEVVAVGLKALTCCGDGLTRIVAKHGCGALGDEILAAAKAGGDGELEAANEVVEGLGLAVQQVCNACFCAADR